MVTVDIFKKLRYFDLNISFQLDKEVLAIQGPSGAGKTTILECIAGIKKPDMGTIIFDDKMFFSGCKNINMPVRERKLGYVFQNYALFPHMTVKKNILFGLECIGIKDSSFPDYLMDAFKISRLADRYPSQISGGEKQRAALARALAPRPRLLLLDEPFSALDNDTKMAVYDVFYEIRKKYSMTVILVTHDEEEACIMGGKILRVKDGSIC